MKSQNPLSGPLEIQTPSFWAASAVVWTACVLGMAISPMSRMEWVVATFTDKTVHGAAFALGAIVWANAFKGISSWIAIPVMIGGVISLALGGLIELLQRFVPGRSPEFGDLLADVIGVLTASLLLLLKYQLIRSKTINK
ncbi:VanZ family protein [bacterium]|nr:VanZ family protein [bacterium]MBU1638560.1 VanZ family protein [bacterium]MBU1920092.1 VanZ family protein [bacterium]